MFKLKKKIKFETNRNFTKSAVENMSIRNLILRPQFQNLQTLFSQNDEIILDWAPILFITIFFFLEIYFLWKSQYRDIPWNWLNSSKLILLIALTGVHTYELILEVFFSENVYNDKTILLSMNILSLVSVAF